MVRMNKTDYAVEWSQSICVAGLLAVLLIVVFSFGGFSIDSENGRVFLFIWALFLGIIATYIAIFKVRKSLLEGVSGGYL